MIEENKLFIILSFFTISCFLLGGKALLYQKTESAKKYKSRNILLLNFLLFLHSVIILIVYTRDSNSNFLTYSIPLFGMLVAVHLIHFLLTDIFPKEDDKSLNPLIWIATIAYSVIILL